MLVDGVFLTYRPWNSSRRALLYTLYRHDSEGFLLTHLNVKGIINWFTNSISETEQPYE